ncbi:hypothetical protein [Corynebacterium doosanense]|uniref:Uncharacterized protein n=1 Tax=Corynebacterium doosanense CAU 212 = DSM 45436 TaxID=558173 RepID=A0A097IJI8_9CORY|nr:hypothetical protein [Corynebacterium doosanense]AIT62322.1 hypothetical protein CDOO_11320 [Corynebacterium doosanense CAU 212 = DSM 45436]
MKTQPRHLASFAFLICAFSVGFSFGYKGGDLTHFDEWASFLGFTLIVSIMAAALVWIVATAILGTRSKKIHPHAIKDRSE